MAFWRGKGVVTRQRADRSCWRRRLEVQKFVELVPADTKEELEHRYVSRITRTFIGEDEGGRTPSTFVLSLLRTQQPRAR